MSREDNSHPIEGLSPEMADRIRIRWQAAYNANTDKELRSFYDKSARLIDIGAGTGLVGEALQRLGFTEVTAVDFSQEILDVARRKGVYRDYRIMNLNFPLAEIEDNQFDATIGVGVFSYGQVEAVALDELVRIVRPHGYIVFTQRVDFYDNNAMGFKDKQDRLAQDGVWRLIEVTAPAQYLPKKEPEVMFRAWVYQVLSS
jgi:2-polyprenyl-3-methyl-5-hydroxy-6-metoxy-1,4-benzoquinol methylase